MCGKRQHAPGQVCFLTRPDMAHNWVGRDGQAWTAPGDDTYLIYEMHCKRMDITPRPRRQLTPAMGKGKSWGGNGRGGKEPTERKPLGSETYNQQPPPNGQSTFMAQQQQHMQQGTTTAWNPGQEVATGWQPQAMLVMDIRHPQANVATRGMQLAVAQRASGPPPSPSAGSHERLPVAVTPADAARSLHSASEQARAITSAAAAALRPASAVVPVVRRVPAPQSFGLLPVDVSLPPSSLPDPARRSREVPARPAAEVPFEATEAVRQLVPALELPLRAEVFSPVDKLHSMGLGLVEDALFAPGNIICIVDSTGKRWPLPRGQLEIGMSLAYAAICNDKVKQSDANMSDMLPPVEATVPLALPAPAVVEAPELPPAATLEVAAEQLPLQPEQQLAAPFSPAASEQLLPAPEQPLPIFTFSAGNPAAATVAAEQLPAAAAPAPAVVLQAELPASMRLPAFPRAGVSMEQWRDRQQEPLLQSADRPPHLCGYGMVNGIIIATSTAVPAVYTLPYGPAPEGLGVRSELDGPDLPFKRAILDSGANMVLIERTWAEQHGIEYESDTSTHMLSSNGRSTPTCGRVKKPLLLRLCRGTAAQTEVAVAAHVVDGASGVYDILLGTPFINSLGGEMSSVLSAFTFRPDCHKEGGSMAVTQSVPMCCVTELVSEEYRSDFDFMLAAVIGYENGTDAAWG